MSVKQTLIKRIEAAHDMEELWHQQWEACGVHGRDRCSICGLTRDWYRNGQNSPDQDEWQDLRGKQLSLKEAVELEACIVPDSDITRTMGRSDGE